MKNFKVSSKYDPIIQEIGGIKIVIFRIEKEVDIRKEIKKRKTN